MGRSVVLRQTPRCPRCQLAPRWCICAGGREIACPLRIDVLTHYMEEFRPSSTGYLIKRVLPASGRHVFRRERPLRREEIARPGAELWVVHPEGEDLPAAPRVADLQVLLLDGTWRQTAEMMRAVAGWGRRVRLPLPGKSRYWLRAQAEPGRLSTVEALLFLLAALGLESAHAGLRAQFELHVFASLMARGQKQRAADYLGDSPARAAFPELIERLRRSRRDGGPSESA